MVSEKLLNSLYRRRAKGLRLYRLAIAHGLTPSQLSAMLHGARPVRAGDVRIIRIGAELGLEPDECFAPTAGDSQS